MANEYAVNKSDLTAVANAIRTKTGTGNTLAFPNGFVSAITNIPPPSEILGDTGFLSLSYIDVTIGANTVALGNEAIDYLEQLVGWKLCAAALLTNPTTQNQLIMAPGAMTHPTYANTTNTNSFKFFKLGYRYRTDNTYQCQSLIKDYAFVLKEGSRYRLWISNVQTSNLKPY